LLLEIVPSLALMPMVPRVGKEGNEALGRQSVTSCIQVVPIAVVVEWTPHALQPDEWDSQLRVRIELP
jgi:hypothetical protein